MQPFLDAVSRSIRHKHFQMRGANKPLSAPPGVSINKAYVAYTSYKLFKLFWLKKYAAFYIEIRSNLVPLAVEIKLHALQENFLAMGRTWKLFIYVFDFFV